MKQCIFDHSDNFCLFTFFIDNIKREQSAGEIHQVQKPEGISVNRDTNSDGMYGRRRNIKEGQNRKI